MKINSRWLLVLAVFAFCGLIAWSVQAQRRSLPSSSWEYKVVFDGNGDRRVEQRLNQVAGQGWELVSVMPVEGSSEVILFLKRPMQRSR